MKHLDLFSGIGGFALACEWAGIETIGFVEIDKYCQKVLRKHWSDVPIVGDIRDVGKIKEIVANSKCLGWEKGTEQGIQPEQQKSKGQNARDICTEGARLATTNYRDKPAILVTGGFPCQPFSVAGKLSLIHI